MGSTLFGSIAFFLQLAISILQWVAATYVVIKIIMLGFSAMKATDSATAIEEVKQSGISLVIGICIIFSAFFIKAALSKFTSDAQTNSKSTTITVDTKDDTNW